MSEELQQQMEKLTLEVHEIRLAISGGDLSGKPGVLQNMIKVLDTLFDSKEGLAPRLIALERRELERKGWLDGAKFVWAFLASLITWLLTKYVFK